MKALIPILIVLALALYGCARVVSNYEQRDNPPASCQLLGGTWNFWGRLALLAGRTCRRNQAFTMALNGCCMGCYAEQVTGSTLATCPRSPMAEANPLKGS